MAEELQVTPDTIRKAIKRVEARNPGCVILESHPVTDYGKSQTLRLIPNESIPLIERALRSPRSGKIEHPYSNRSRSRGHGGFARGSKRGSFTLPESQTFRELRLNRSSAHSFAVSRWEQALYR